MEEFWEQSFKDNQKMWGEEPAEVTLEVNSLFLENNFTNILIPGFGYGRNAKIFIENGFNVTGIEISETAIEISRDYIQGDFKLHHGSVGQMPFDHKFYQGIYCYALVHLLNNQERIKFIRDCYSQLEAGGIMVFVTLSTKDHRFGKGREISENTFQTNHGVTLYFHDAKNIAEEFGSYGLSEFVEINEPTLKRGLKPSQKFWKISCRKS